MMDNSLVPKKNQEEWKEDKATATMDMAGKLGLMDKGQILTDINDIIDKGII